MIYTHPVFKESGQVGSRIVPLGSSDGQTDMTKLSLSAVLLTRLK
jgi:hypothetical protein